MIDPQSHDGADLFERHIALDRNYEEPPVGGPSVFLCDRLRLPLPTPTKRT